MLENETSLQSIKISLIKYYFENDIRHSTPDPEQQCEKIGISVFSESEEHWEIFLYRQCVEDTMHGSLGGSTEFKVQKSDGEILEVTLGE